MSIIILILVLLLVFGGLPRVSGQWHNMGWGPSGLGIVLVIILVIVLLRGGL